MSESMDRFDVNFAVIKLEPLHKISSNFGIKLF